MAVIRRHYHALIPATLHQKRWLFSGGRPTNSFGFFTAASTSPTTSTTFLEISRVFYFVCELIFGGDQDDELPCRLLS
jgi:hypothetical protein